MTFSELLLKLSKLKKDINDKCDRRDFLAKELEYEIKHAYDKCSTNKAYNDFLIEKILSIRDSKLKTDEELIELSKQYYKYMQLLVIYSSKINRPLNSKTIMILLHNTKLGDSIYDLSRM